MESPPSIPPRSRHLHRPQSVPPPAPLRTEDANYVHIQPASPEVISNLISTLSIISSPASQLFEKPPAALHAPQPSPRLSSFGAFDRYKLQNGANARGSFGIDYGAYNQPSLYEETDELPIDEQAASPPVIRTSKPPSGFSSLTSTKSPGKDVNPSKFIHRISSRPSSKDSSPNDMSIGNLSIEPGLAPTHELRRQSSSDSWGKKQAKKEKGLMYMSSKERLRDSERKQSTIGASGGTPRGLGIGRLAVPELGSETFLAESPINEEPFVEHHESSKLSPPGPSSGTSPSIGGLSPAIPHGSPSGIDTLKYIPARDSSLGKPLSTNNKRSSYRSSRQGEKQREEETADETIKEVEEDNSPDLIRSSERGRREKHSIQRDVTFKLQEPLTDPALIRSPKPSISQANQGLESARTDQGHNLKDEEYGAPWPAVSQRKTRAVVGESSEMAAKMNGASARDSLDRVELLTRKDGARNRLSVAMSLTSDEKEEFRGIAPQRLARKTMGSPEPIRPLKISTDERPTSADSVDDAVDAYLRSPRLSQKIPHPQSGRIISFSEVGDPEGFAIFCCVGMGLTRYITAFYDELALTLKLRLITPDRPGIGQSEPYEDGTSTPLSWPDDVYAICQTLKITKFSILAHSAGAIYALATALRMPQHIRGRIHLLAPWIPPSQLNVFGAQQSLPPTNSIPTSQRILRALPTPILKAANSSFMSATSSSITSSLPKSPRRAKRRSLATASPGTKNALSTLEKENYGQGFSDYTKPSAQSAVINSPSDPNSEAAISAKAANTALEKERQMTYETRLTQAIWELATLGANPAVDLLVCLERRHTIGFRYVDISRACVIHHGTKDTRVPVDNVKWLGKMMRRCEVRILEGEGHGLMASATVMSGVLTEMAREWEDWTRVVEHKPEVGSRAVRILRERASMPAFR